MAPEKGQMQGTLLEQATVIRDALLDVQKQVLQVAEETELRATQGIRNRLGYEAAVREDAIDLVDTRIRDKTVVITPRAVATTLPISKESAETVRTSREHITAILTDIAEDDRLVAVVGPCSIHSPEEALEYAAWLRALREEYKDDLEIIMRAYMEKPRSELGWKGLVYDPLLDDSSDINLGIVLVRMLACQITHMGVPIAMERLNANTPQYVNGLVSYDSIGARNTTDQKAREYASGTSSPVGFKNTHEGSIEAAVSAVISARAPHTFLGLSMNGMPMQVATKGNLTAHVILRGDKNGPNYSPEHVKKTRALLRARGLPEAIVIDASHGNSGKDAARQVEVIADVSQQIAIGETSIRGIMIESNLMAGSQKLVRGKKPEYGVSTTDACVDLADTKAMFAVLAEAVRQRRVVLNAA